MLSGQDISKMRCPALATPAPSVVLDTNATLDWLVFKDAAMQQLTQCIEGGQVRWLASPRMRDELQHMLCHPRLASWSPDAPSALKTFDNWVGLVAEPRLAPAQRLLCSDSDDQVFIDLALAEGASWLVTHDRALLKLARKARPRGVVILPPVRWSLLQTK
jgi:uncharacterized protein